MSSTLAASPTITLLSPLSQASVPLFSKFEVDFLIADSEAVNPQWPYDPDPPHGVPPGAGISVDGVFIDPEGREYRQPAFYYQEFEDEIRDGREWHYPTDSFIWRVRFSPNLVGTWQYRIAALDKGGASETESFPFGVVPSDSRGFVAVSRNDPRYFEFEDGTFFPGLGVNMAPHFDEPERKGRSDFEGLHANGISFVRMWVSSIYGSAWNPYVGARNRYSGYLPVTGLVPFADPESGERVLTMRIDYERQGDEGWFDACRQGWSTEPEAVKPNTRYRVSAVYQGKGIEGPRVPSSDFGFVIKLGGRFPNCHEAGTSRPATEYGRNSSSWNTISGTWNSGRRHFLPPLYLALENVRQGAVYIREVSIREELKDGSLGPEILAKPSMEHHLYIPQKKSFSLDKIVELAEEYGIYLKLVVMEKGDKIYLKIDDDGELIREQDNQDGFYGLGRAVNKTRWLQQAWWRYLQARWGYSPNIHSWELTNEGDPTSERHYELADEFAKYMHCRVFGVETGQGDGVRCTYDHPNDHLVTTSFWHSFPAGAFWGNEKYPNLDYADLHAYVSTSFAPLQERRAMMRDAAFYHVWHSQETSKPALGKPVVRGEAGLDAPSRQDERVLGIDRERSGVWLHNFLWAGLDSGGLYEMYWWQSHLVSPGRDLRSEYARLNRFLVGIELSKGGYVDWAGTVDNADLRVVGQKNPQTGKMHLWLHNCNHTWKNVLESRPIPAVSGWIIVPGFAPGSDYVAELRDTRTDGAVIVAADELQADFEGTLTIRVESLEKDLLLTLEKKQ